MYSTWIQTKIPEAQLSHSLASFNNFSCRCLTCAESLLAHIWISGYEFVLFHLLIKDTILDR